MSSGTRDIAEFTFLVETARNLCAADAKVIPASDVVVENRVPLKCRAGCIGYGKKLTCPPHVPTPDEFRKILAEYRYALLVKFISPANADLDVICSIYKYWLDHEVPADKKEQATLRRRLNSPAKGPVELPQLDAVALKKAGADILMRSGPSTLATGHLLVTGEVERKTAFENGMPGMEIFTDGNWNPDPIRDDQALVINILDKGLVVLIGCAHAGIINTVEYAKKISGIDHVHAVLGGFHLTGPAFAPVIQPTIDAMKRINPDYVVPMHCTGWDAINRFMTGMPGRCILNTVGTTYLKNRIAFFTRSRDFPQLKSPVLEGRFMAQVIFPQHHSSESPGAVNLHVSAGFFHPLYLRRPST